VTKGFFLASLLIATTIDVWCQVRIRGTVISLNDKLPIPGVSVVEKGTKNGTVTAADGEFNLDVSSISSPIVFSLFGYQTQDVKINSKTKVEIALKTTPLIDSIVNQKKFQHTPLFKQFISKEAIEIGELNSNIALKEIIKGEIYDKCVKKKYEKNNATIVSFEQGKLQPFDAEVNGEVSSLNFNYELVDDGQLLTTIIVMTDINGKVIDLKSLKKFIYPYLSLIEGKVKIGISSMLEIAKQAGLKTDSLYWTIQKPKRRLIWVVEEATRQMQNRYFVIDATTGDILAEGFYGSLR